MRQVLVLSTFWALSGAAPAAWAAGHDWAMYANAKYQFQICYPADLLHAQGESPASDGQVFTGADGAKLTASAIYNVDSETLARLADETAQRLAGDRGQVTYRHVVRNSFTLSGKSGSGEAGSVTAGDQVFYAKTILSHDAEKHFELVYPASLAATYNPIAAHLQSCFVDLQK